jgi:hypothetical protein
MTASNILQPPQASPGSMREIAFVHIGKNAGTQIMHLAQQLKPHGMLVHQLSHSKKLYDVPLAMNYFFSIRDPITRFKSGFYSRKRKGQPRIYAEWTKSEAAAFGYFEHANHLAEALFRQDDSGYLAAQAIQSIRHTAMQQIDWFERIGFLDLRPPVWIIRQENFTQDFETLLQKLGLALKFADLKPAQNAAAAHSNDYSQAPPLSDLAKENLRRWYARDFVFYELCVQWMKKHGLRS